jgi:septum formation protein
LGCAGAYRIQGKGSALIKSVRGSYPNVVGLPIYHVVKRLRSMLKK